MRRRVIIEHLLCTWVWTTGIVLALYRKLSTGILIQLLQIHDTGFLGSSGSNI